MEQKDTMVLKNGDDAALKFCLKWVMPQSADLINAKQENDSVKMLKNILKRLLMQTNEITLVMQRDYVDRVYRDCYYLYFATKHSDYSRFCTRLFLFAGNQAENVLNWKQEALQNSIIGCIVIKPLINGSIGRSLLNPYYFFSSNERTHIYLRTTTYHVLLHGVELAIQAFPFSMQDSETITCAEVSLLNIMDYYSNQYADYALILPRDIIQAERSLSYERTLPTHGMHYEVISKVLSEFGFSPRLYIARRDLSESQLIRLIHYYIESAIPVAVGIGSHKEDGVTVSTDINSRIGLKDNHERNHSIVCIGHATIDCQKMRSTMHSYSIKRGQDKMESFMIADTADACEGYVVIDDAQLPYTIAPCHYEQSAILTVPRIRFGNENLDCAAIPLYKHMYLEGMDAHDVFINILTEPAFQLREAYNCFVSENQLGTTDNPLIIRIYLASTHNFRKYRITSFKANSFIKYGYYTTPFPKFVWVCELFDFEHYQQNMAIGEIILDATSSAESKLDSVIMIQYPGQLMVRGHNGYVNQAFGNGATDALTRLPQFVKIPNWEPFMAYSSNLTSVKQFTTEFETNEQE